MVRVRLSTRAIASGLHRFARAVLTCTLLASARSTSSLDSTRLPPVPPSKRDMGTRTFTTEHSVARSLSTPLTAAVASFDRSRWDLKPSTKTSYFKTFNRFGRFIKSELGRAAQLGDL